MFTGIGPWEILVLLFIILIIFGPKRLPEMGKSLGKAIKEFKNAGKQIQDDIDDALNDEDDSSNKAG